MMFYAKLSDGNSTRLFPILDYRDGKYLVYIDFVFTMKLTKIVYRQDISAGFATNKASERARRIMNNWPEWKRNYKLTKYSTKENK